MEQSLFSTPVLTTVLSSLALDRQHHTEPGELLEEEVVGGTFSVWTAWRRPEKGIRQPGERGGGPGRWVSGFPRTRGRREARGEGFLRLEPGGRRTGLSLFSVWVALERGLLEVSWLSILYT